MPRVRQKADVYARNDFFRELDIRRAYYSIRSDTQLSLSLGLCHGRVSAYRTGRSTMDVDTLRAIVRLLSPDIGVVLRYLGYDTRQIKKFKEEGQNHET